MEKYLCKRWMAKLFRSRPCLIWRTLIDARSGLDLADTFTRDKRRLLHSAAALAAAGTTALTIDNETAPWELKLTVQWHISNRDAEFVRLKSVTWDIQFNCELQMQDVRLTLFTLSEPCDLLRSRYDLYHGRRRSMLTFELPNSAYVTAVSIWLNKKMFFLFVFTMIFFVFLWSRSIKCCTRFVRENGLSPIFSGLWMGKCFELHTVSKVFYQQGLLLPTLERLRVNVRSLICLWTCLQLFGLHLPADCWSSFSALPFQNYSNSHCHCMGYHFILYSYLFCLQLARIRGECLWNLEIFWGLGK